MPIHQGKMYLIKERLIDEGIKRKRHNTKSRLHFRLNHGFYFQNFLFFFFRNLIFSKFHPPDLSKTSSSSYSSKINHILQLPKILKYLSCQNLSQISNFQSASRKKGACPSEIKFISWSGGIGIPPTSSEFKNHGPHPGMILENRKYLWGSGHFYMETNHAITPIFVNFFFLF